MKQSSKYIFALLLALVAICSCRKDEYIIPSTSTQVSDGQDGEIKGFFLLNEGNMGSNKATLDFYDYTTGIYHKNIYPERNPSIARELGDVGNDIKIWGDKLYAVINCSNFVEVMDVNTAEHITQISIPNCRYLAFKDGYAYVSSFAGPVSIDPTARLGYVAKIDTLTMSVVDECTVGYQPEQMAVVGDKLYVANSGGYMVPNYDNTVSVIDLNSFEVIKTIEVEVNLHCLELDDYGYLWVSSRGDYYDISSKTFVIDTQTDQVVNTLNLLPNSTMTLCGDSLYVYSSEWSYSTNSNTVNYAIVNTQNQQVVTRSFITDGSQANITEPYGLAVNPYTREIFITDAKDYVTPGTVHCYSPEGNLKWSATTGDAPAHIVFTNKILQPLND
ncbi:MAG: YncE family protein [Rikenellaceae bacterium]